MNRELTESHVSYEAFINAVAMYWFFLSIELKAAKSGVSNEIADELIDAGGLLKGYLAYRSFNIHHPLIVHLNDCIFFNIWLDSEGNIRTGKFYNHSFHFDFMDE